MRLVNGQGAVRNGEAKRPKLGSTKVSIDREDGDEEFLPEDKEDDQKGEDGVYLSAEVRDLMTK